MRLLEEVGPPMDGPLAEGRFEGEPGAGLLGTAGWAGVTPHTHTGGGGGGGGGHPQGSGDSRSALAGGRAGAQQPRHALLRLHLRGPAVHRRRAQAAVHVALLLPPDEHRRQAGTQPWLSFGPVPPRNCHLTGWTAVGMLATDYLGRHVGRNRGPQRTLGQDDDG